MRSLAGRTALITGASSGIGRALAQLFARDGCRLAVVARRVDALQTLVASCRERYGVDTRVIARDLADSSTPRAIVEELDAAGWSIDFLVNNAGFGLYGPLTENALPELLRMIHVNVTALTELTHRCLPPMLARRSGGILNVASTAAFQPGPLMAGYYATKAYVLSLSEALDEELRGTGVTVTCLCPGPTRSEFQARAGVGNIRLLQGGVMDAATVALAGYRGLLRGRRLVIPGVRNRLLARLVSISPRRMVTRAVRYIQERRES